MLLVILLVVLFLLFIGVGIAVSPLLWILAAICAVALVVYLVRRS